jgi:hypothetical protein
LQGWKFRSFKTAPEKSGAVPFPAYGLQTLQALNPASAAAADVLNVAVQLVLV